MRAVVLLIAACVAIAFVVYAPIGLVKLTDRVTTIAHRHNVHNVIPD